MFPGNEVQNRLVIGFDSWTVGAQYFERLCPEFQKNGYRLLLIHIGSWGHDKNRPCEEKIGDLQIRDISYYGRKTVREILEMEKPSAVIFMSTRALAHMAFNRYARYDKIPTCHLYHGLVMVQAFGKNEEAYKINYLQHLSLLVTRIGKNLFTLIPFYARSLRGTSASLKNWLNFVIQIINRGIGIYGRTNYFTQDMETDIGCVYTIADVEHMNRNYRIPIDKIFVVGNPDLASFRVSERDMGYALGRQDDFNLLIYIDTALCEAGVVFNSARDFIRHILNTKNELESAGYKFAVKLHPAHFRTGVAATLMKNGVDICTNENFVDRLKIAKAALVEPSSAAIIPALLGMPVLLGQYERLSEQVYGQVLTSYPRSRGLSKLSEIRNLLYEEQFSLSKKDVMDWIEKNRGPMPAEEMPKRAVTAICKLIEERSFVSNVVSAK